MQAKLSNAARRPACQSWSRNGRDLEVLQRRSMRTSPKMHHMHMPTLQKRLLWSNKIKT